MVVVATLFLLLAATTHAAPIPVSGLLGALQNAAAGVLGGGGAKATGQPVNAGSPAYSVLFAPAAPQSATDAYANFANHVYGVSASILGMSSATNTDQIGMLANIGYSHEALESIEATKMAGVAGAAGAASIQVLQDNTPCILNGMKNVIANSTPANALLVSQQMSTIRDALILPNILALGQASNAANLVQFPPTGPALGQGPVAVQTSGSAQILQAQQALNCAK
ncbi:hypothetical protein BC830DRAFT_81368 [Chytriomyces sp. MP71]|nr:hypothetical protein BC830DRAFT_81368 [Chytriomyces sp. MP71]